LRSEGHVCTHDEQGCMLPAGHQGAHEFIDASGDPWCWETDLECDCERCAQMDGDFCVTYWKKPAEPDFIP
jgi:hypothetical protein